MDNMYPVTMANTGGKEGSAIVSTYAADNLLYQESIEVLSNQENTISFTWTPYESGSIQITSEVEDAEDSISKYAYVQEPEEENTNPVASITAINGVSVIGLVLPMETGDNISFSSSSSYDNDGSIVSFKWTIKEGLNSEEINQENLEYKFDKEGNYEVTLTIVDNDGGTSTSGIVFITVSASTNTRGSGSEDEGSSTLLIGGGGIAGILVLGAVVGLKYFRNK